MAQLSFELPTSQGGSCNRFKTFVVTVNGCGWTKTTWFLSLVRGPSKLIPSISSKTFTIQSGVTVYLPAAGKGKKMRPLKLELAIPSNRSLPSKWRTPVAANGPAGGPPGGDATKIPSG